MQKAFKQVEATVKCTCSVCSFIYACISGIEVKTCENCDECLAHTEQMAQYLICSRCKNKQAKVIAEMIG